MPHPDSARRPLLARLLRDRAANTLVIMAIALIPLSAMAGSAVDVGRLYVVKSRLQQACDAGVLAGRKFMAASNTSSTLDATADNRARTFFANNFTAGWLQTRDPSFVPAKTSDSQVSGTASVVVPMTVTKMFAATDTTISVTCKARYDVADTDIVFVLDTTGSMACRPEDNTDQCATYTSKNPAQPYTRPSSDATAMGGYPGTTAYAVPETTQGNGSRIKALRQAVKDFYNTMKSSADSNTRLRYSFVTYTSTINAGKAIYDASPRYLVGGTAGETWNYQTRKVTGDYVISSSDETINKNSNSCKGSTRTPTKPTNDTYTYNTSTGEATIVTLTWTAGNNNTYRCVQTTQRVGPVWSYNRWPLDVTAYSTGVSVTDPTRVKGETTRWEGCIEERDTQGNTTGFTSKAYDLDPDLVPGNDIATKWRPMWPTATWARWWDSRYNYYTDTVPGYSNGDVGVLTVDDKEFTGSGFYSCGKPILRLKEMSAADVAGYVDAADFRAIGGTYHDTGMIWGVRMLSAKGIFASDNTGRAGQPVPKKVIVFLTDGDMSPSESIYGMYGIEKFDQRVGDGDANNLKAFHNARFLYECNKARDMGIDVWTVAIGLDSTTELTQCARNSAQALDTTSGSGLSTIFQQIARQVAMLRIEK